MLELELKVYGQVQRVGYRYSLYQYITENHSQVVGFVENQPDGSVLLKVYGKLESLKSIREYAINGIENSNVRNVEESLIVFEGNKLEFNKFEINE